MERKDYIQALLRPEVQEFISRHLRSDLPSLLLKKSPFPDLSMQEVVQQIRGRKVASKKFGFLNLEGIVFPPGINLEQASSQPTAAYKSNFFSGERFLDLTAGMGIDAFFIGKNFSEVTLLEQNADLLQIVAHNWQVLGRKAKFICADLHHFLRENTAAFDLIYLDPARRDSHCNKKFLLEDLSPDLLEIYLRLLELSPTVMVKLSPLIDLTYLVKALEHLADLHIIAVRNEVKEVVLTLKKEFSNSDPQIHCVNLESAEPTFSFTFSEESACNVEYSEPLTYLCLPNNAVLKSGAFKLLAVRYGLKKLHQNTQLYTSEEIVAAFPGRIFQAEKITAREIQKGQQYNIISKNHPLSPPEIRKKFQLRDGGEHYLIFTRSQRGTLILKCAPIFG